MKTISLNFPELENFSRKLEEISSKLDEIQTVKPSNEWLGTSQVASLLDVTPRTLQNYRDNGLLPFSKVGSKIYYRRSDVERHLQDHYFNSFNEERRGE